MNDFIARNTRRQFLARNTMGIGGVALAWLLNQEKLLATPKDIPREQRSFNLRPKRPHFAPKAKRVIWLMMRGGVSHLESFDPKKSLFLITKN